VRLGRSRNEQDQSLAVQDRLSQSHRLITRLLPHDLRVRLVRQAVDRMKKIILLWIMNRRLYSWLMLKVIPYIRFTTYYTSFKGFKYHQGYELLQPGDFIVSVDKRKLTTLLVPGTWTHASFCVSKDRKWEVSEMTHENYCKSCFFDICKEADRVAIYRWNGTAPAGYSGFTSNIAYIEAVISHCKTLQKAIYDVEFELGVKALYCSELVYQSDFNQEFGFDLTDIAGLGRPYISPDGLTKGKYVHCVWDSGTGE
jgi:hypothetical protein